MCKLKNGALKVDDSISYITKKPTGGKEPTRWGEDSTTEFESGEGVIVYNGLSNLFFRVSGEVVLEPMYCIPGGKYSIFGNNTPNQITLGDIGVYGQDGTEYDGRNKYYNITAGRLTVCKLQNGALKVDDSISYITKKPTGGKEPTRWGEDSTVTLDPGESVVVYNGLTNLYFRLKSPISK